MQFNYQHISGIFRANLPGKANKKAKIELRFQKKKIGRMSDSGQEKKKSKSSSDTVLKATVFVSGDKKNISFTEIPWTVNLLLVSCNLELKTAT